MAAKYKLNDTVCSKFHDIELNMIVDASSFGFSVEGEHFKRHTHIVLPSHNKFPYKKWII